MPVASISKMITMNGMHAATRFGMEAILEAIWPTRCAICYREGGLLCKGCLMRLPWIDQYAACPRCGSPHGLIACTECNSHTLSLAGICDPPFDSMRSAMELDDDARMIVTTYKDRSERRLGRFIARAIANCIAPEWICSESAITYVPDTDEASRRRGFDHGRELAGFVASELSLPCKELISQPRATDQRKLGRRMRFANMAGTFTACREVRCPSVILVDDVSTTGATIFGAAHALRQSGASHVFAATFGRVV